MIIDAMKEHFSISYLTKKLAISSSSYYYASSANKRSDKYRKVREVLVDEFEKAKRSRGYRYLYQRLKQCADVRSINEKLVRRIMKEEGLEVIYLKKRRRKYNSYAGEITKAPNNLVKRDFHADKPNKLWLTDITEFRLPDTETKVYLSPIIDCFDGRLVSWSIGTAPTAKLANQSLIDACCTLQREDSPIIHSDRGSHYRWPEWIQICKEHNLTRSMSKKACSPNNSTCEGFFGRLKNENFYYRDWAGVDAQEFMIQLEQWLVYYNEERLKESLGWMSPNQYHRSLGLAA